MSVKILLICSVGHLAPHKRKVPCKCQSHCTASIVWISGTVFHSVSGHPASEPVVPLHSTWRGLQSSSLHSCRPVSNIQTDWSDGHLEADFCFDKSIHFE